MPSLLINVSVFANVLDRVACSRTRKNDAITGNMHGAKMNYIVEKNLPHSDIRDKNTCLNSTIINKKGQNYKGMDMIKGLCFTMAKSMPRLVFLSKICGVTRKVVSTFR